MVLGLNLFFIVAIPTSLAVLAAYYSRPDRSQYDELDDYTAERYRWLADVGLHSQLAGLTTVVGTVLDRQLFMDALGVVLILIYTIAMLFGLGRYRDHRYQKRRHIPSPLKNDPFIIGVSLLVIVEILVFYVYLTS